MNTPNSNIIPPSIEEIINSINNEELRVDVIERLKQSNPIDDEIIGVKLFLKNNKYDFNKLESFLQSSQSSIDNVIERNKGNNRSYGWLKVAVVLVPLIGISSYFLMNKENKFDNLYSNYYEKELGLPVTLSDENNKLFNESMNLFRDEDYTLSLQGFRDLLLEQPNNDTLHYFIGVCLLEKGNLLEAKNELTYNFQNIFFKEKATYRLALLYLKLEQVKESKILLQEISENENHRYYQQAKALLGKL
jgi:TolA-binding protein